MEDKEISGPAPSGGGKPDFSDYGAPGLMTEKAEAAPVVNSRIAAAKSETGT
jgi:hypothetical protein